MRIVSADSAAAILDEKFTPIALVASAAVLVNPPYREPAVRLAEPIFREIENGCEVILTEISLCRELLGKVKADAVHLDMTLGAVPIETVSPVELSNMKLSSIARQQILKVLPALRKIAGEIRRTYGVDVLAIGKESVPVRVAELTAGAEAVLFACAKAVQEKKSLLLGLPVACQPKIAGDSVCLYSLLPAEHDVRGYAEDSDGILKKVNIVETLNPCARGFRALKIKP